MSKWLHANRNSFLCLLLLLIAGTGPSEVRAQERPRIRIEEQGSDDALSRSFEALDASRIPTKLLHDKASSFVDRLRFDGTPGAAPTSLADWRQLYRELAQSRMSASAPDLPTRAAVNRVVERYRRRGLVPLGLLNMRYNAIKPNALQRSLLQQQGGRLLDAPQASASPYATHQAFAVAAFDDQSLDRTVRFVLPPELYLTNQDDSATRFEIDFGDGGGPRSVQVGEIVSVTYATSGRKTITLTADEDTQTRQAATTLRVADAAVPAPDRSWLDQTADRAYAGEAASYDARVFYGAGSSALTHPIVFVEGFDTYYDDPAQRRTWQDIYELLAEEDIGPTLQSYGYDLVIMKLHHAADYIQRNAFALEHLLNTLNAELEGSGPLVVVGPSMGGLISRYALADMEQRGLSHNARLFVSLDAPHQGANLPLGDQFFFEFFDNDSDKALQGKKAVNSPAARQMLIYHYQSLDGVDSLRANFTEELDALGYPDIRMVAMADGSGLGLAQPGDNRRMDPGDKIVEYHHRSFLIELDGDVWAVPDEDDPETQIFEGRKNVIGPHNRTKNVYAEGTRPIDNAPGGQRGTQADIAEGDPQYGTISTHFPDHDWIPTISALDLDTDNLFYNLREDPEELVTIDPATGLPSTATFDAIYYPEENTPHVTPNAENAAFLLQAIGPTLPLQADVRVFLQGPYRNGSMNATLNASGHLPLRPPYDATPWNHAGSEAVAPDFFVAHPDVVDWVLLELRPAPEAAPIATRAALLTSAGRVVDTDGTSPVAFADLAPGAYHVVMRHRNHLAAMSAAPVTFSAGAAASYDFTTGPSAAYGANPLADLGSAFGLIAGDADANGQIQNVDKNVYWQPSGGTSGYKAADFDLNGQVQNVDKNLYWKPNGGRGTAVPVTNGEQVQATARLPATESFHK